MSTLISATLVISVAYFAFAFVATMHDSLVNRRHVAPTPAPEPVAEAPAPAPAEPVVVKVAAKPTLSSLIRSEVERPKTDEVVKVDHGYNLPNSIRELRAYIREQGLQQAVKAQAGKSVSNCTKQELVEALTAL